MAKVPHEFGSTLLKVSNVSLTLGGKQVLRDVNLEIKDVRRPGTTTGQVVGLLGPSGIGKTQLFRILAGLNKPDHGSVLIGEEALPVHQGMVGVVAQHYPLFAHRRVLGNLLIAGRRAGMASDAASEKAKSLLARFKLEDAAGKYPIQLSGGQRQRVAIAQQFMCSERFLLMDEPFSGLDLVQIQNVIELINEVACLHEFNTIIIVTHDISAALEVADTLWLLGRDRDAAGNVVPGARVQASYDLMERGLAWQKGISETPEFLEVRREVRERFPSL
jgi:polar amino acid transport system ATP-binding protein/sulfate transport system ATP-binding protein